jgi:hypothetical protein
LPLLLVLLPAALKLTCCLSNPYNVYKVEHASLFRVSRLMQKLIKLLQEFRSLKIPVESALK